MNSTFFRVEKDKEGLKRDADDARASGDAMAQDKVMKSLHHIFYSDRFWNKINMHLYKTWYNLSHVMILDIEYNFNVE